MKKWGLLDLAIEHYPAESIEKLGKAIDYATEKHRGQKRDSGEAYISHPLSVASLLIEWQMDMNTVIAGVLHDCIEDTDADLKSLEAKFGHEIAFLVDGVTKVSDARSGMGDISHYLPQTKSNLSKLLIAVSHDLRVLIIKLADRLHNLQTLEYLPTARQHKVAAESLDVFAPLADRLGMGKVRMQLEELSFSYLEPKEYQKIERMLKKKLGRSHKNLEVIKKEVAVELDKTGLQYQLDGRVKSVYSLYKKLKKTPDINRIYDLMALRIIVPEKEDCYQVLGILHNIYQPVLTKIKDYIAVPKPNGYQSLHTTVITPSEQIIEFQIRSKAMHSQAERGLAASFHYNEQKITKNYLNRQATKLPRNLEWITQLQEMADKVIAGENFADGELAVDIFGDRIFVYSPKGDIYDLPEGAFPLDFAFAIHSDIALHAHGFKVNGKISPFSKPLHNGDIVEVQTSRSSQPKKDWLDCAKTHKARSKIKNHLKKSP